MKRYAVSQIMVIGILLLMMVGCTTQNESEKPVTKSKPDVEVVKSIEQTATLENRKVEMEGTGSITKEILLQNASEVGQLLENYYIESRVTMYAGDETDETVSREWFYWRNGEQHLRKEIEREDAPTHYIVGNDRDSIIYTEGDEMAIRSETLVQSIDLPSQADVVQQRIASYKESHNVSVVGKDEVNGRNAHHMRFTPKKEAIESGTTIDLWIDSEHWLVLKEVLNQGERSMEYEVLALVEGIEPPMDLFQMDLPEGVEVIDQ
ncbi:LolA family protein [Salinicoccus cyprini]|uniref:LolA family protein n=1 Tax=Salinicoccus cyprini TaxID=2493691 RepID=UPI0016437A0F|nr:hypothetical protein [Salinicoccus cyprini]